MSEFLTNLDVELVGENNWCLLRPLVYHSDLLRESGLPEYIVVPEKFRTDLATVPRIPIIYVSWGDRAHREAVLHDYLYRKNLPFSISRPLANKVFLEAMESRKAPSWIKYPMYWGVCVGGFPFYQKKEVFD